MPFDQDDLVACLVLTAVDEGVLEGRNLDIGYHRVFGGQILAQVVAAAAAAATIWARICPPNTRW